MTVTAAHSQKYLWRQSLVQSLQKLRNAYRFAKAHGECGSGFLMIKCITGSARNKPARSSLNHDDG